MKNEINDRIKKLKEHFEKGGYKGVIVKTLDYQRKIDICIKTDEYSYPAHFPVSLSDEDIIKEMEDVLSGKGASEYSIVDWRPPVYGKGPQKLKPGGAI